MIAQSFAYQERRKNGRFPLSGHQGQSERGAGGPIEKLNEIPVFAGLVLVHNHGQYPIASQKPHRTRKGLPYVKDADLQSIAGFVPVMLYAGGSDSLDDDADRKADGRTHAPE